MSRNDELHIYQKVGIRSRQELVGIMTEADLANDYLASTPLC